jgi:hypothetical protein
MTDTRVTVVPTAVADDTAEIMCRQFAPTIFRTAVSAADGFTGIVITGTVKLSGARAEMYRTFARGIVAALEYLK